MTDEEKGCLYIAVLLLIAFFLLIGFIHN